jgi:hypothetical protein
MNNTYTFGVWSANPIPYSFNGMPGFFTVPAGHSWFQVQDSGGQIWVSPNPIALAGGIASGFPLYAADLNLDGTLVFQDLFAARAMNIDSPPHEFLSQSN